MKKLWKKLVSDLFYDTPIIEIKDGKIYFSAKPKFHFFDRSHVNYQTIIGERAGRTKNGLSVDWSRI